MHSEALAAYVADMERKNTLVVMMIFFALAGCSRETQQPAQRTTVLISGAAEEPREPITVRSFAVQPASARAGSAITAVAELDAAHPDRTFSVDWFGPDGWLDTYSVQAAQQARMTFTARNEMFREPGRHRAVLRVGRRMLGESFVTIEP